MKNLLLKFKGWLGAVWAGVLDHYVCVCSVLILIICFFSYTLKLTADYEKELNELMKSNVEAIGLIQDQGEALTLTEGAMERQSDALQEQGELINKLVNILNQQKATIEYQNRIIEELVKRLRDNNLLPEPPSRSEANWILYESPHF